MNVDVPNIPHQDKTKLSVDQIKMMKAYIAWFLQGVQQNSIWNTNTKNKAGTLPPYAYLAPDPEPDLVNSAQIYNAYLDPTGIIESQTTNNTLANNTTRKLLYRKNNVVSIPYFCHEIADVFVAKCDEDVIEGQIETCRYIHQHLQ